MTNDFQSDDPMPPDLSETILGDFPPSVPPQRVCAQAPLASNSGGTKGEFFFCPKMVLLYIPFEGTKDREPPDSFRKVGGQ